MTKEENIEIIESLIEVRAKDGEGFIYLLSRIRNHVIDQCNKNGVIVMNTHNWEKFIDDIIYRLNEHVKKIRKSLEDDNND